MRTCSEKGVTWAWQLDYWISLRRGGVESNTREIVEGTHGKCHMESAWDEMAEADMVEEVTYEEVVKTMNKMKLGKATGPIK